MVSLATILPCLILLLSFACGEEMLITEEFISNLKSLNPPYKVCDYENCPFTHIPLSRAGEVVGLEGVDRLQQEQMNAPTRYEQASDSELDLPTSFDSRDQWPDCNWAIVNQGSCNSCWAHAAVEVVGTRYCIKTGEKIELSAQHLVSCADDDICPYGYCQPCETDGPYNLFYKNGNPTSYCQPFVAADLTEPVCQESSCTDEDVDYRLYKTTNIYTYFDQVDEMKNEIMTNGPLESIVIAYRDFMAYQGNGIYQHLSDDDGSYHAVITIGWGQEDGVDYWLIQNSWGTDWGDNGFGKVKMGEIHVDEYMMGTTPDSAVYVIQNGKLAQTEDISTDPITDSSAASPLIQPLMISIVLLCVGALIWQKAI